MSGMWGRLGVRTRSTLIGFVLALVILGLAIASIFARHEHDAPEPEIRVKDGVTQRAQRKPQGAEKTSVSWGSLCGSV